LPKDISGIFTETTMSMYLQDKQSRYNIQIKMNNDVAQRF